MPCCYSDPIFELPVTIGTFPIDDNVPVQSTQNVHPNNINTDTMSIPSEPSTSSGNVITQQPQQTNSSLLSYPSTSAASHPLSTDGKTN